MARFGWLEFGLAWWLVAAVGCGMVDNGTGGALPGRVCYLDSDCVPNGCCGEAQSSIHVQDAPDCTAVSCSGNCPHQALNCGCALPVCLDGQCGVASTAGGGC